MRRDDVGIMPHLHNVSDNKLQRERDREAVHSYHNIEFAFTKFILEGLFQLFRAGDVLGFDFSSYGTCSLIREERRHDLRPK